MRTCLDRLSNNELFDVLALGWVFASFLQGIAGFGTPIAIVAPLLVAIGVRPVYAVAIPIIAHIWAKFFGTLGVSWFATLAVVDLDPATQTAAAVQSAILLCLQTFLGGFTVVWLYGRWPAVRHAWPLVLIIASIHGIGQIIVARFSPVLAAAIPATIAMLALYPLSRWPRYAHPAEDIPDRPAMDDRRASGDGEKKAPMGAGMSYFPYILLTALALCISIIEPINRALGSLSFGLPFPEVATGYGVTSDAESRYSPLAPLTHPGFSLLVAALVAWVIYRSRGYYEAWAEGSDEKPASIWAELFKSAVPASVPIIAFLVMAALMSHSGENDTLALGIAAIAGAQVFAFLSNGIGVIGAFTTSSSTSSNVLFTDLQVSVAELKELPPATIVASQSAGGAIGNAIAPVNAVMGASTVGISGEEGAIVRKTLGWTIATFLLTGVATVLMVLFTS